MKSTSQVSRASRVAVLVIVMLLLGIAAPSITTLLAGMPSRVTSAVAAPLASCDGSDLLQNGGFEDGLDGWTGGRIVTTFQ